MAKRQWSIKHILYGTFGAVLCLVALLGTLQYGYALFVKRGTEGLHLLYSSISSHSLNTKDASILVSERLVDFFNYDRPEDWAVCEQALQAARDEVDHIFSLLELVPSGSKSQVLEMTKRLSISIDGLKELMIEGRSYASVAAGAKNRFYDFIMRPGLHSLRSLEPFFEVMHTEGKTTLDKKPNHYATLKKISHTIALMQAEAIKGMLERDSNRLEQNADTLEELYALVETLEPLRSKERHARHSATLKQELEHYASLQSQYHFEWGKVLNQAALCQTLSSAMLADATELIEKVNFLRDSTWRSQQAGYTSMQRLLFGLVFLTLAAGIGGVFFLYRKVTVPLHALAGYTSKAAYGRPPARPQSSGTAEIDTVIRLVSDMAVARSNQYHSALMESKAADAIAMEARHDAAAKTAFLARMSHEMRTPMNGILAMSYLCQKTTLTQKQQDYLQKITTSAESLLEIIDDILDFLRLEADKMAIEHLPFSVSEILFALQDRHLHKATTKGLALKLDTDKTIPDVLMGDAVRITQVLHNLLENAIQFTQKGSIGIHVKRAGPESLVAAHVHTDNDSHFPLHFHVSDTGVGLSPNMVEQLNKPLYEPDGAESPIAESGLGLAICRRLIHVMHGSFQVHSDPEEGSSFHFVILCEQLHEKAETTDSAEETYLPKTQEHPVETLNEPASPARLQQLSSHLLGASLEAAEAPAEALGLSGFSVLVAEDQKNDKHSVSTLLTNCGLNVTTAHDGEHAVHLLQEHAFDLIFMDNELPVMDGFVAARHMRALATPWAKAVPLIAMTPHDCAAGTEQGHHVDIQGHLTKPVTPEHLRAILIEHLVQQTQARSLPHSSLEASMAALDVALGLHHLNGNEQLYNKLLRRFADSNTGVAQEIRTAVENSDMETAIRVAHTLKGVAASLGAPTLSAVAMDIEQLLKEGPLAPDALTPLEAELANVWQAIEARLA